jgi:hypothetical protein
VENSSEEMKGASRADALGGYLAARAVEVNAGCYYFAHSQ